MAIGGSGLKIGTVVLILVEARNPAREVVKASPSCWWVWGIRGFDARCQGVLGGVAQAVVRPAFSECIFENHPRHVGLATSSPKDVSELVDPEQTQSLRFDSTKLRTQSTALNQSGPPTGAKSIGKLPPRRHGFSLGLLRYSRKMGTQTSLRQMYLLVCSKHPALSIRGEASLLGILLLSMGKIVNPV